MNQFPMENGVATQLTTEAVAQLQEGINLILSRWTALQMAVMNEWGGRDSRQKSQQLAVNIFSWLTESKEPLYLDDLEDFLDEFMLSLNAEIGDGSIEEIAEKIMIMHEECLKGNYSSITRLRESNPPRGAVAQSRQAVNDDDDSDDETLGDESSLEMLVDAPEAQPRDMMVDEPTRLQEAAEAEDGWTLVASKRTRDRRT